MRTRGKLLAAGAPAIALALGTLSAVGIAGPTFAAAPTKKLAAVSVVTNGAQAQAKASFDWTDAMMAAAKPMDTVKVKGTGQPGPAPAIRAGTTPGAIAGSAGAAGSAAVAKAAASVAPFTVAPQSGGFTYPTPFTRYEVEPQVRQVWPYTTIGKLYFTQNGGNYVCSASAIGPHSIWTAGHCSSDGAGHFSTNVVFVPGLRDTNKPFGKFSCNALWTTSAWHFSGDLQYDYAGASCGLNAKGQDFAASTGWLGFAWNWGYGLHYDDFGYPAAAPFNGVRMQRCESSFGHADTRVTGLQEQAIGCDMTGGSSGGPWIWQFGTGNYVNGENSYKYVSPAEPLEMYSPYYGDLAKAVYDAATA